jgi:hypothetical protein
MALKLRINVIAVVMGLAGALMGTSARAVDSLPACIPGVTCLQFGDFNVFSLPLLGLTQSATPGALQVDTVIGINNGNTGVNNNSTVLDSSFNTPSAANSGSSTFTTLTAADPGSTNQFAGDFQSWDAPVSQLKSLVPGVPPLVAFFGFNEDGSTGPTYNGLAGPDLLIWASVTLCPDGGAITASCSTFILGNNTAAVTTPPSVTGLPDNPDPSQVAALQAAGWVYVHGTICLDGGGGFAGFPDLTTGNCPAGTTPRSQVNLGQNNVAFMIDSPALDAALVNPGANAVLHITWEMAYISGGGETAFFAPVSTVTLIPEPATLALVGLALFAAGLGRRTKNQNS